MGGVDPLHRLSGPWGGLAERRGGCPTPHRPRAGGAQRPLGPLKVLPEVLHRPRGARRRGAGTFWRPRGSRPASPKGFLPPWSCPPGPTSAPGVPPAALQPPSGTVCRPGRRRRGPPRPPWLPFSGSSASPAHAVDDDEVVGGARDAPKTPFLGTTAPRRRMRTSRERSVAVHMPTEGALSVVLYAYKPLPWGLFSRFFAENCAVPVERIRRARNSDFDLSSSWRGRPHGRCCGREVGSSPTK